MVDDLQRLLAVRPRDVQARVSMLAIADQLGAGAPQVLQELIDFFAEQRDWGLSVSAAEQLIAETPEPALAERTRYVELLGHSGQAVAQLQVGKELITDLLRNQQRSRGD